MRHVGSRGAGSQQTVYPDYAFSVGASDSAATANSTLKEPKSLSLSLSLSLSTGQDSKVMRHHVSDNKSHQSAKARDVAAV